MNDTMKLTLQLTAVDMLSGIVKSAGQHIKSLGEAGRQVQKDFEVMTDSITKGLKGIAAASFVAHQSMGGIHAAGDLQEAMIDVKMSLMTSGKAAAALNDELSQVRRTAINVAKTTPFTAMDVAGIENTMLKAGLNIKDVVGKSGAAWAATAVATITKELPESVAETMTTTAASFGLHGQDFAKMGDLMQRLTMTSEEKMPDLQEGLKYVASTAHNMRISLRDTITSLGVLGSQGLKGSIGGTSLNEFLRRLTGASRIARRDMAETNAVLRSQGKDPLEFWDKNGKLKSLPDIIKNLRTSMSGFTDEKKMFHMEKIFGDEGMRAALALMKEHEGSWEEVTEKIAKAADMETKLTERLGGFNASLVTLATTAKSTLASLFDPMLKPLTKMNGLLTDAVGSFGELAEKHKVIAQVASGSIAGAALGAGVYGAYQLRKGVGAGARVLRGVGGLSGLLKGVVGTGVGIEEGKVLQAATGVTPVFVTNWPGSTLLSPTKDVLIETAAIGEIKSVGTKAAAAIGAESVASLGLLAGATVGAGLALGTGINYLLGKGGPFDSIAKYINNTFGLNPYTDKNSKEYKEFEANKKKEADEKAKAGQPPVKEEHGWRGVLDDLKTLANRNVLAENPLKKKEPLPWRQTVYVSRFSQKDIAAKSEILKRKDVTNIVLHKTLAQKTETMKNITHNVLPSASAGMGSEALTTLNWLINKSTAFMSGVRENSLAASLIYDFGHGNQAQMGMHPFKMPEVKNNIALSLVVNDRGPAVIKTSDPNTNITINSFRRGSQTND